MRTRQLVLWGPVALVAGVIFILSSMPSPPSPTAAPDWLLHGIEFGVLGLLLARALAGGTGRPVTRRVAAWTLVLGVGYSLSDEIHQAFVPGRQPALADVIADAAGGLLGLAVMAVFSRLRPLQVSR